MGSTQTVKLVTVLLDTVVSLKLQGVAIPNNSFVHHDDLLYRRFDEPYPTNANPELLEQSLLCVTDLVDCCDSPRTVCGHWYFHNGKDVTLNNRDWAKYRIHRTSNEILNNKHFYGSIGIYR